MEEEHHPPHIYAKNSCYFLTASTIGHRRLFDDDAKRSLLHDALEKRLESFGIKLYAWAILADHYHLLLRITETAPLHVFVRSLHSGSAQALNRLEACPGRSVWYQYWDRFAHTKQTFWSYFNYIHVNPMKHGYVQIANGALTVDDGRIRVEAERAPDLHECLAAYRFSSYHYYLDKYGAEFLTDIWIRYPIPDYLAGMDV